MFLFYFQMGRKIVKRFYTFSKTNHDVKNNIPILMAKINCHFTFLFFTILESCFFVNNVVFDLKLFKFWRTEFFFLVFQASIFITIIDKFINILKYGLDIFHKLNTRGNFILFLLFFTSRFDFTDLTSILTEFMIIFEETFEWDILRERMVGKITFILRMVHFTVWETVMRL